MHLGEGRGGCGRVSPGAQPPPGPSPRDSIQWKEYHRKEKKEDVLPHDVTLFCRVGGSLVSEFCPGALRILFWIPRIQWMEWIQWKWLMGGRGSTRFHSCLGPR